VRPQRPVPPPADVHGGRGGRRRCKGGLVLTAGPRDGSPFRSSSTGSSPHSVAGRGTGVGIAGGERVIDSVAVATRRSISWRAGPAGRLPLRPPARASAEPLDQPPALPLHLARQPSVELAEELA